MLAKNNIITLCIPKKLSMLPLESSDQRIVTEEGAGALKSLHAGS
jgi:hypothetical protein